MLPSEAWSRRSLSVTASTDSLVVSVFDMMTELREDDDTRAPLIEGYIDAATEVVKEYLRRSLRTETLALTLDGFGRGGDWDLRLGPGMHSGSIRALRGYSDIIELPKGPVQSIASVVTYGRDNAPATFATAAYRLDAAGERLVLNEGYTWPSDLRDEGAVVVTYVAGYGAANVPAPIREAIKEHVKGLYDGCARGVLSDGAKALLAPYRRMDALPW